MKRCITMFTAVMDSTRRCCLLTAWCTVWWCVAAWGQEPTQLTITLHPDRIVHRIDEKVYGHFLEHIYNSCNGGLWGELIWNRSFELNSAGQWSVQNGVIAQLGGGVNKRLTFGDPAWTDYEYTLEARKTGGAEGFLILFRVAGDADFYWANLGGWGNKRHGLERGRAGEERWHGVGRHVPGTIEKNRWYRIRVRCEGPQFQVWLDAERIIDFRDDQLAHLRGKVGVGTWATQAEYRQVRVATLDGKELFSGAPEMLVQPLVAKHWKAYGPGRVLLDSAEPLNSRWSQRVVGTDGETGLEQTPLRIRSGETYRGSLWARGQAAGLVVRLRADGQVLGEAALPAPTGEWRECPFRFQPTQSADNATIQVGVRGPSEVRIDQVSLMPDSWAQAGGFRPDLVRAVAELRPPVIRWPGGCFASAYRWKDGIGPQHKRGSYPIEIWDDRDTNSYGTDEFVAMCRQVGAEPLIVVNIGTPQWRQQDPEERYLQDLLDWIEYCNGAADSQWGRVRAANGHPEPYRVKYWEIDNETWGMGAEAYAAAVRKIAPLMKKADPTIKLAACGSAGYGLNGNGLPWNKVVIERCAELIDYLSIHHYENPDRYADGPRRYEEFFRQTGDLIRQSQNPNLKIDVSEWNAQSTDWRTGLYAGGLLNAFERCGDVLEIGGPALFLRHVSARAWDNAFVNFDHRTWFPAPNYVVMKLWREHYAPHLLASDAPERPLNATATKTADGRTVFWKAVNPDPRAVAVTLKTSGDWTVGKAELLLVNPGDAKARNTLDEPHRIAPAAGAVRLEQGAVRFSLPPLSAAVVRLTKK
jgi:alpha-N-arabinofuranosidase